jgi:hypothetical protein
MAIGIRRFLRAETPLLYASAATNLKPELIPVVKSAWGDREG